MIISPNRVKAETIYLSRGNRNLSHGNGNINKFLPYLFIAMPGWNSAFRTEVLLHFRLELWLKNSLLRTNDLNWRRNIVEYKVTNNTKLFDNIYSYYSFLGLKTIIKTVKTVLKNIIVKDWKIFIHNLQNTNIRHNKTKCFNEIKNWNKMVWKIKYLKKPSVLKYFRSPWCFVTFSKISIIHIFWRKNLSPDKSLISPHEIT